MLLDKWPHTVTVDLSTCLYYSTNDILERLGNYFLSIGDIANRYYILCIPHPLHTCTYPFLRYFMILVYISLNISKSSLSPNRM